ncbi:hypothetical protein [uncultured Planktomarina sp.]|jgi:hypothetical protein|uniref:hypothetical protein n=1 Tax=uncultured Planktomarina sp. TaxID=1538529 RepID=UPI003260043E
MQDKYIKIIIHAGAHKTASTHLQNRVLENENLVVKSGCSYLGPEKIRDQFGTLWRALGRSDTPDEQKRKLAALAAGQPRLVISEENIIGGFKDLMNGPNRAILYPKAVERLARLAQLVAPNPLHIAMAVREPSSYYVSVYNQLLLSGRFQTWERFSKGLDPTAVKWSDILRPIAEIPGVAAVSIWRYEDYHRLLPQILNTLLGQPRPDIPLHMEKRMHEGLSERAVQACCTWHAAGYDGRLGAVAREDFPVSDAYPKFSPWPEELMRESRAAYGRDIEALGRAGNITVLE